MTVIVLQRNFRNNKISHTVRVDDLNTPLSSINRSSRRKLNREILELKTTVNQMNLTGTFRTFHPKTEGYASSAAHDTFSNTEHVVTHYNTKQLLTDVRSFK